MTLDTIECASLLYNNGPLERVKRYAPEAIEFFVLPKVFYVAEPSLDNAEDRMQSWDEACDGPRPASVRKCLKGFIAQWRQDAVHTGLWPLGPKFKAFRTLRLSLASWHALHSELAEIAEGEAMQEGVAALGEAC